MPESQESQPPRGVILPLDVVADAATVHASSVDQSLKGAVTEGYSPDKQHDLVRLIVTSGLLVVLGYVVVFATVEAASYPQHWTQTKELLQILLPALTGVIGTVIGFYFGTAAASQKSGSSDD